jgi:hypothetical protein
MFRQVLSGVIRKEAHDRHAVCRQLDARTLWTALRNESRRGHLFGPLISKLPPELHTLKGKGNAPPGLSFKPQADGLGRLRAWRKPRVLVDGRNVLEPDAGVEAGFTPVCGFGRSPC